MWPLEPMVVAPMVEVALTNGATNGSGKHPVLY